MCMANDWSQGIAEYSRNLAHFERKKIKKTKGWSEDQGGVWKWGNFQKLCDCFDERQVMPFTFDIQAGFCRPTSVFGQLIDR